MGLFGMLGQLGSAGIATGGQLAATIATNQANKQMTEDTNEANRAIADANNQTSIDIANRNNEMQVAMNRENNQFSSVEAQKARDYDMQKTLHEEAYNSPLAQLQRYREAGLNPAVMMQGQNAVASSTSASGAVASPHGSGVTPSMPLITTPSFAAPQFAEMDIFHGLRSLSEIAQTHAQIRKSQAESKTINDTRDMLLQQLQEDVRNKQLTNDVIQAFGMLSASDQHQKLVQDVLESSVRCEVLASEGKLNEAQEQWTRFKASTESHLSGIAKKQLDTFDIKFRADLRESASRANANNAQASLSREELSQLQDMHKYIVDEKKAMASLRGHESRLTEAEANEKWQTLEDAISYLKSHYAYMRDADKREVDLLGERLKYAQHDNNWRVYHEILDAAERINNGITNWIPFAPDKHIESESHNVLNSDGSWRRIDRQRKTVNSRSFR